MTTSAQKIIIATKQEIDGFKRKLAWFELRLDDLYLEIAGIIEGSHISYDKDGNVFRTSPATNKRAKFFSKQLPLLQFHGLYSLGIGMVQKSALGQNPRLKNKDSKYQVYEVDIDQFPSETLNIFAELLEQNRYDLIISESMRPPIDAHTIEVKSTRPWIIITILGHEHNLLVCPYDADFQGVTCRHFNKRYSASPPGGNMVIEAYKLD